MFNTVSLMVTEFEGVAMELEEERAGEGTSGGPPSPPRPSSSLSDHVSHAFPAHLVASALQARLERVSPLPSQSSRGQLLN